MSHKWNKFSGQGSPLISNCYLSTSLSNHKSSSVIQHNWQSSVGNIVWVERGERCYCLVSHGTVNEKHWRNSSHRDGIRPPSLCRKAASRAHPMSCATPEAFNAPLFCSPEWSVFMAHPLGGLGGECLWQFSMLIGMNWASVIFWESEG